MGNISMSFYTFTALCPHCKPGFDEMTSRIENTCRHPDNIPRGCSWGECCEKKCPLLTEFGKDPDSGEVVEARLEDMVTFH